LNNLQNAVHVSPGFYTILRILLKEGWRRFTLLSACYCSAFSHSGFSQRFGEPVTWTMLYKSFL